MTIKVLTDSIINKIAAGEVIERPANVIKELLENALDAQATDIHIDIEESGLRKIKITDNGIGMDRDDLHLSYKRHATSKITSEDDLFEIESLGFRGEALASIAEISHLVIKSKTKDSDVGHMIEIEGGILLKKEKIGSPDGTIIEITNLFYNVPARKKFLKSPEVELAHIIDIVTRYALIKKDVAITLTHNGKEIINSQKTKNDLNNLIYIYGVDMAKNLLEVSYNEGNIKIKGFISKPNLTRANKNEQSLYVNGRYIRSKTISDAIYEGYKTLLFTNRHPVFVLHIDIDPQNVDVNIHPSKLDVRFKHEGDVYDHVAVAIKEALHAQPLIQTVSPDTETKRKPTNQYEVVRDKQSSLFVEGGEEKKGREEEFNATISSISSTVREEKTENPLVPQQKEDLASVEEYTEDKFLDFVILGQINKTFIVAENREGLIVIDQHAAEERINYEKFMDALKDNAIKKQTLIGEKVIELNPVQFQTVMNNKDILRKLGFDFEEFGGTTIKLQTIPEIFGKLQPNLFVDIINELAKVSTSIVEKEIEEKITKFACRASIKAGEELTREQMSTLIIKLGEAQNPYTCPHGRPTIIQITNADLEKKFKRTGW